MDFLNQICIASTVFSVGVTLLDLMSLIGQGNHDGDSSHADSDADGHGTAFAAPVRRCMEMPIVKHLLNILTIQWHIAVVPCYLRSWRLKI